MPPVGQSVSPAASGVLFAADELRAPSGVPSGTPAVLPPLLPQPDNANNINPTMILFTNILLNFDDTKMEMLRLPTADIE
jgi:hypothetical protein